MEFCGIPESEAEIPIPDPPARGAVPAEFTTKPLINCPRTDHIDGPTLVHRLIDGGLVHVHDPVPMTGRIIESGDLDLEVGEEGFITHFACWTALSLVRGHAVRELVPLKEP